MWRLPEVVERSECVYGQGQVGEEIGTTIAQTSKYNIKIINIITEVLVLSLEKDKLRTLQINKGHIKTQTF